MAWRQLTARIRTSWSARQARTAQSRRKLSASLLQRRVSIESLEDRVVFALNDNLVALQNAAAQVTGFGSNLNTNILGIDIPVLAGGTAVLNQITNTVSTFSSIGTQIGGITPSSIVALVPAAREAALESALGAGFDVTQVDDTKVRVVYTKNIGGQSVTLSAANTLADFFGGAAPDYLEAVQLSGTAGGTLDAGTRFQIIFGADASGFFIEQGDLFSGGATAAISVTGSAGIENFEFAAELTGTAAIDLNSVKLTLNQTINGADLANISSFSQISFGAGSEASLSGTFTAEVLGVELVRWSPEVSFPINANGSIGSLTLDADAGGAPQFINETSLRNQLISSLANSLGLNKLGVALDPLADVPDALKTIITLLSALTGSGLGSSAINPQSSFSSVTSDTSKFSFASTGDLLNIVSGNGGTLLRYDNSVNLGNFSSSLSVPIGAISVLGLVNFIFSVGANFDFNATAQVGFALDSKRGLYFDTNDTKVQFVASAGPGIGVDVNLIAIPGLDLAEADITAAFTTTATVKLDDKIGNPITDGRVYLSDLGASFAIANQGGLSLGGVGQFLASAAQLEIQFGGQILLDVTLRSTAGAVLNILPDEIVDAIGPYLSDAVSEIRDFATGAVETVCDVVEEVPIIGGIVEEYLDCKDVVKVAQVFLGDYLIVVDEAMLGLGATLDPGNTFLQHTYHWAWPIITTDPIIIGGSTGGGANAIANGNDPNNAAANPLESAPTDYIKYKIENGVLTVTAREGDDEVEIENLGGGNIRLYRFGIDTMGGEHRDPTRTFSGITQIIVQMNEGDDYFLMSSDLAIPATVYGSDGDDDLRTGAADDFIYGGIGKDYLSGRGGKDNLEGGSENDKLYGGEGDDILKGEAGEDTIYGNAGEDDIDGGTQDDKLYGGDNDDVIHGGTGKDKVYGGSGEDELYGDGEDDSLYGGDDSDKIYGGAGNDRLQADGGANDQLFGEAGMDMLYAGSGSGTLDGGTENDFLYGDTGPYRMLGGQGDDYLEAGNGDDTMIGGGGNDAFVVLNPDNSLLNSTDKIVVYGGTEDVNDAGQSGDFLYLVNGGGAGYRSTFTTGNTPNSATIITTNDVLTQRINSYGVISTYDVVTLDESTAQDTDAGRSILIEDGGQSAVITLTKVTFAGQAYYFAKHLESTVQGRGGADQITINNPLPATNLLLQNIEGNAGADTFLVQALNVVTNLDGGSEDDSIQVGNPSNHLDGIQKTLNIEAGSGDANRLVINDLGSSGNPDVVVTNSQITGFAPATINYAATGGHFTNGGTNDGILLRGSNTGADQFTVVSTLNGSTTQIQTNGGTDRTNVGSKLIDNNGNLDSILGLLTIDSGDQSSGAKDVIYINDFANPNPANYLVTPNSVTDLPAAILSNHPEFVIPPRTLFAGINYSGNTEFLQLDGNNRPNFVSAIPSVDTAFSFNGHLPGFGDPLGADCLIIDFTNVIGKKLSYTGLPENRGKWSFKNRQPIEFRNFECLNFSGNAQLVQEDSTLFVTADDSHNGLSITRGPNGEISVVGLGTTLNGSRIPMPLLFTGVTNIVVETFDGDDFLQLNNVTLNDLVYLAGNGDDQLQVGSGDFPDITTIAGVNKAIAAGSVSLNGTLHMNGGDGVDCADFIRTFGQGVWDFNLGDGDDMLTTYWTSSGAISAVTDAGNDVVNLGYHVAYDDVTVDGVGGNDFVNVYISNFKRNAFFFGGSGYDTIAVDTNYFERDVLIDTGADYDYFLFAASIVNGQLTLIGGSGSDYGLIGKHVDGSSGGNIANKLVLDTDGASDTILIGNNAFDYFFAELGSGDDHVTIDDYLYIKNTGVLNGGIGKNTLVKIGTPNLTISNF